MKAVGVRFRSDTRIHYFDPGRLRLQKGQHVLVEGNGGAELGTVAIVGKEVDLDDISLPIKKAYRVATNEDLAKATENIELERDGFRAFLYGVKKHQLAMRLVDVECSFNRNRLTFYFTADERLDFRDLVRDLARDFGMRIEFKHIGVRDEAKVIGGIGSCGRILCCSSFLSDFVPVSIKMVKDQGISLNPSKVSGICGRLMCCLQYESEGYEGLREEMPDLGDVVVTLEGKGEVVGLSVLEQVVQISLFGDQRIVDYSLGELLDIKSKK